MIYAVKPIKKCILLYSRYRNGFTVELSLHPNQKWMAYDYGDTTFLSKGVVTIEMSIEEVNKYFREVEE